MTLRILLISSSDNGLTRRIRRAFIRAGHRTDTSVVGNGAEIEQAVLAAPFDLILAPYLVTRIPDSVFSGAVPCVVLHPGPVGDRGGASLDWAITDGEPLWGVTALGVVADLDAGPVWATRTCPLPEGRKSDVYNTVIADLAVEIALEVAAKAADPTFTPTDQATDHRPVPHATARPLMRQSDRSFTWDTDADTIIRRIHAADGSPGVRAELAGHQVHLYDAHPGRTTVDAYPGTLLARDHHAIEIACGDQRTIWIGHLRIEQGDHLSWKAPAVSALTRVGYDIGSLALPAHNNGFHDIVCRRIGATAVEITFHAYNGAMSIDLCHRLAHTVNNLAQRSDVGMLVLRGRHGTPFSNGLHLGEIGIADDPAAQAWRNINAINTLCRALLTFPAPTFAAVTGSAGAGGAMLALTCDIVATSERAVLDPHYATMGLAGSEFHSLTLPRRVGAAAAQLLSDCEPIDARAALELGFADLIGPDATFEPWLENAIIDRSTPGRRETTQTAAKHTRRVTELSEQVLLDVERRELAEMHDNLFNNSRGFREKLVEFLGARPTTVRFETAA